MQTNQDQRVLLRVKTAAEKLDISVSQAYALISRGEIEVVRIGKSLRVPARVIEQFASAGKTCAA